MGAAPVSIGPGKYDDEATIIRSALEAQGVILLVLGGTKGSGCAVQMTRVGYLLELAPMLEKLALEMRRDAKALQGPTQ